MPTRPERPGDADYYERDRVDVFSQGDLFRDVPLAYPLPADELLIDAERRGTRRFLSGPLEFGPAMLITPSCSLAAQGAAGYSHPVRTLVPVVPLEELVARDAIKQTALPDLRRFDHLINFTRSSRASVSHSWLTAARSSCSGSSSGSTPAGSKTTSTSSTRQWIDLRLCENVYRRELGGSSAPGVESQHGKGLSRDR